VKVELDFRKGAVEAKGSLVLPVGGSLKDYAEFTRRYLGCKAVVVKFCDSIPVPGEEDGDAVSGGTTAEALAVASVSEHDMPGGGPDDPGQLADPVAATRLGYGFYAGFPLYLDSGERLGMLAAVDAKARELTGDQMATLKLLAAIIVQTVSFRLAVAGPQGCRAIGA
jgi:hypothetical protein